MIRLLHISDTHYGLDPELPKSSDGKTQSAHYFVDPQGRPDPEVLPSILSTHAPFGIAHPDVVVVSGDIGWSGRKDDYKVAIRALYAMRTAWPNASIVVTPGNHDVNRDASNPDQAQQAFVEFLREFYGDEFRHYYPKMPEKARARRLSRASIWSLHVHGTGDKQVVIASCNSSHALHGSKNTPVTVGTEALTQIAEALRAQGVSPHALRIFVVHHHLFPFAEPYWGDYATEGAIAERPDDTLIANSARLQDWLSENRFSAVLHGHRHLSHARQDTLWRKQNESGCALLVLGAGSAGVNVNHRPQVEPLTFNVVDISQISTGRWLVDASVVALQPEEVSRKTRLMYSFRTEIGVERERSSSPSVFHAVRMDDCHRAIRVRTSTQKTMMNFLSIVEDHTYVHPQETISFKGEAVSADHVENTFQALHPEYQPSSQWVDDGELGRAIANPSGAVRFEHGSRWFSSSNDHSRRRSPEDVANQSPIHAALARMKQSDSQGYMSLYRVDTDLDSSGGQPIPGLMSIQFVPDGKTHISLVATFRKVELSYWWVVNMLELGRLLTWAADRTGRKARRISFFAAIAEWKDDPEAVTTMEIDRAPIDTITQVALTLSQPNSRATLIRWISEKESNTNANNVDTTGMERLCGILRGVSAVGHLPAGLSAVVSLIETANRKLRDALSNSQSQRILHIRDAATQLKEASLLLINFANP